MRVLILNQTFYPDVAATAQHMWDLARHLDQNGHEVCAVTSRTIYGTDRRFDRAHERIGRIDIHRIAGTAFGKKSLLLRMCDFASFYAAAVLKMNHLPAPDVILALTSPPMIAAAGIFQKRFRELTGARRTRLVYHVMDLYPDAAVAVGILRDGSIAQRVMSGVTKRTMSASDAIIVLGRDMADRVMQRYGTRSDRVHIVPPWADGRELRPIDKNRNPLARSLGLKDTFTIVYSGNLGMAHDLDTITSAIELMRGDEGIAWLFIGGGNRFDQLRSDAQRARWPNVQFMPYQDRSILGQSLCLGDVHLVSQLPQFTGILVPSKLYGIMAVGRPSVMIGPAEAECSRVIAENAAGFVVPNGSAQQLAARLRELRADVQLRREMGTRARSAFERLYDRPIACGRIQSILDEVVNS